MSLVVASKENNSKYEHSKQSFGICNREMKNQQVSNTITDMVGSFEQCQNVHRKLMSLYINSEVLVPIKMFIM